MKRLFQVDKEKFKNTTAAAIMVAAVLSTLPGKPYITGFVYRNLQQV